MGGGRNLFDDYSTVVLGKPPTKVAPLSRDEDLAVRTIIGEAKGEGEKGWEGVADVIRNRASKSGKGFADVVLAPNQFEPWSSRRKELESYDLNSPEFQRVTQTVLPVLRGERKGPAGDATHFYGPKSQASLGRKPPSWDNGKGIDIGNHRFFNLGYSGKGVPGTEQAEVPDLFGDYQSAINSNAPAVPPVDLFGDYQQHIGTPDNIVPESPETIQAQAMSALNPNQTARVAILLKPEEVSQLGDSAISQFIPLPQADGRTLFVAKNSGRKLGLKTPKDVEKYVAKNGFAKLIGKVEDIEDTSAGMAVMSIDPATGKELTSSRVTDPVTAQAQIATDQIAHPGAQSTVVDAQDVVNKRFDEIRATTPQPAPTEEAIQSLGNVGEAVKAGVKAPAEPIDRKYTKREIKPGESYYGFEQTGKTKNGDEYLGMVGKSYYFRDKDGDEFRIENPEKGEMNYLGERKKAYDVDKNEYVLADQSDAPTGTVRRTRIVDGKSVDYLFGGEGIREEFPKLQFKDGTVQSEDQENIPDGYIRMEKDGEKYLANPGDKEGSFSIVAEKDFGKTAPTTSQGKKQPVAPRKGTVSVSAEVGQPASSGDETMEFDLRNTPKGMSAREYVSQEKASRLSSKYSVPYDEVLRIIKGTPAEIKGDGGEATDKYYESIRNSDGFHGATIGASIIEKIKAIPAKLKKVGELKEQYKSKYPEVLSDLAEIDALVDVGDADRAKADEIIKTETDAYNKWLAENPDVTGPGDDAYKGTYDRAAQGGIKQRQEEAKSAYKSKTAEILKDYGSFKNYFAEKQRIEKEYENRPMARPAEFAQNIGRYFLKLPATAVKALGAGADILSSEGIDPKTNPFLEAGREWEKRVDASKNPDFKKELIVNDLAQGAGQLIAQGILAPLTGGASLALPLVEGGVGQYEEASAGTHNQRALAGVVGALAAVPDALLKAKYLKMLTPAEKTGFLTKLTQSLFGKLSKEVGEAEAKVLTRSAVTSLLKNTSTGAIAENIQERSEDIINKALAKATYKPETEVFKTTPEEEQGYKAASILGALGGSVETFTEQMALSELEKAPTVIDEALEAGTIKAPEAQKLRVAVETEITKRSERANLLPKQRPEDVAAEDVRAEKSADKRIKDVEGEKIETENFTIHKEGDYKIVESREGDVVIDGKGSPDTIFASVDEARGWVESQRVAPEIEKEVSSDKVETEPERLQTALKRLEEDLHYTTQDFAEDVVKIAERSEDRRLIDATRKMTREWEDDFDMGMRGDLDTEYQKLEAVVREVLGEQAPSKAQTKTKAEAETPVEASDNFTKALAELQKADSDNLTARVGSAVMHAETKEQIKQVKEATELRKAEIDASDGSDVQNKTLPETQNVPTSNFSPATQALHARRPALAKLGFVARGDTARVKGKGAMSAEEVAKIDAFHDKKRREWIDKERETNPAFAPDIESKKELLSPEQLAEVKEYEGLHYKTVAYQGREQGYRPYKLTAKEKTRYVELAKKYRHIFYDTAESKGKAGDTLAMASRDVEKTPEFQKFFKGSKVVNEKGAPLIVYHGTNKDVGEFSHSAKSSTNRNPKANKISQYGFFFTPDPNIAEFYADDRFSPFSNRHPQDEPNGLPNIVPAVLNLQNPLEISVEEFHRKALDDSLDVKGHDGIIATNEYGRIEEIVAFEPEQIKSAIGNSGKFDATNPSILAKARTKESQDKLSALVDAPLDASRVEFIEVKTTPYGVEVDEEGMDIVRRIQGAAGFGDMQVDGLFNEPAQAKKVIQLFKEFRDDLKAEGELKAAKKLNALITKLQTDAAKHQGTLAIYVYDDTGKHEFGHRLSYLGVPESANKDLSVRYGDLSTIAKDKNFQTAANSWQAKEGRNTPIDQMTPKQLGHAAEEVATYLANGDDLGLTSLEADTLLVDLMRQYAKARKAENPRLDMAGALSHFKGYFSEQLLERINEKGSTKSGERSQGDDRGGTLTSGTDSGGGQVSTEGETAKQDFTPTGKEKLSQTPKTLRKNDIPVEDRSYTGVTNASQIDFANTQLDKGVEKANKWFDDQVADGNHQAGATTAVGLSLMTKYAKDGDLDNLNKVADQIVPYLTEAGQAIQAMATVSAYDPRRAGVYAAKYVKQKRGKDLKPRDLERAQDIAKRLSESAQIDGLADARIKDLENELSALTKEKDDITSALEVANDENTQLKIDLEKAAKATKKPRESKDPVKKLLHDLEKKRGDINDTIKGIFGASDVLRMVSPDKSEALRKFLEGSVLQDIVHHGTTADFEVFDKSKGGMATGSASGREGFFFTDQPEIAAEYTEFGDVYGQKTIPVYLALKNPRIVERQKHAPKVLDENRKNVEIEQAQKDGNDGVVFTDFIDSPEAIGKASNTYFVFESTQIKSAIGNKGTFDPSDPSILRMASRNPSAHKALVDWATLELSNDIANMSVGEFYNKLDQLTNGQLSPNEIQEIHAESIARLRSPKPMTAQQKAQNTIRHEHYKAAETFENKGMDIFTKGLQPNEKKYVQNLVREGLLGDYSRASILMALARKSKSVNEAEQIVLAEYPDVNIREVQRESTQLLKAVKSSMAGRKIQIDNDASYTEEQIELAKEEKRINSAHSRKLKSEANRFYDALGKSTPQLAVEGIVNFRKANLLTAIKTHFVNLSSNAIYNTAEEFLARPLEASADILASLATGQRTIQGISPTAIAQGFKNLVKSDPTLEKIDAPTGFRQAWSILTTGDTLEQQNKTQYMESNIAEKVNWMKMGTVADAYINTVFRLLSAEDALFKTFAFRRSLEEQAKTIALTENRKSKTVDVKKRRAELLANPTNVMQIEAADFADQMTYQNENPVSRGISYAKGWNPYLKAAIEIPLPFDRTPTNIVLRTLEMTPLGYGKAVVDAAIGKAKPEKLVKPFRTKYRTAVEQDLSTEEFLALPAAERRDLIDKGLKDLFTRQQQQRFARAVGRATLGTAALIPLGAFLAAAGLLTGIMSGDDDPDDPKYPKDGDVTEKGEFFGRLKQGIENKSLLIPGVGRFNLQDDPFSKALVMGATMYEQTAIAEKQQKDVLGSVMDGAGETVSDAMFEQPLMRTTKELFTRDSTAGDIIGGNARTFIPFSSLLGAASEVGDEKARRVTTYTKKDRQGKSTLDVQFTGLKNSFTGRLPILRNYYADEQTFIDPSIRGSALRRLVRSIDVTNSRPEVKYDNLTSPGVMKYRAKWFGR